MTAGRPDPRLTGFGRLRKNEKRNRGWVAAGRRGGRPALTRARSRILRSASSFCLWTRTAAACFISLMP